MAEPENMVLHLLREMREEMKGGFADLRSEMDSMRADLRSEMQSLRADIAADFLTVEKRMNDQEKRASEQIVGLRRAVVEYHSTVVGHGIQISDLESRIQRLETSE